MEMSEFVFGCIASLLFGGLITMFALIRYVFNAYDTLVANSRSDSHLVSRKLEEKVREFSEVTEQASRANESLAKRVGEYDAKFREVEAKLNLVGLKFTGK